MVADYDKFSRQFKKSREFPFRTCCEEFMMLQMLGNLAGLTALDLACGEGHYARMLRRHGAARVIGVDISERMIALARDEEAREPLGVEYVKAAVEGLGVVGAFDVVSAVYLLRYVPTREHLAAMCRAIAANLRPGGRLVAMNSNLYGKTEGRFRFRVRRCIAARESLLAVSRAKKCTVRMDAMSAPLQVIGSCTVPRIVRA